MCKLESYIWIWHNIDRYEYIVVHVDDLKIVPRDPMILIYALDNKYKLNIKGTVPI